MHSREPISCDERWIQQLPATSWAVPVCLPDAASWPSCCTSSRRLSSLRRSPCSPIPARTWRTGGTGTDPRQHGLRTRSQHAQARPVRLVVLVKQPEYDAGPWTTLTPGTGMGSQRQQEQAQRESRLFAWWNWRRRWTARTWVRESESESESVRPRTRAGARARWLGRSRTSSAGQLWWWWWRWWARLQSVWRRPWRWRRWWRWLRSSRRTVVPIRFPAHGTRR